jgi:hypothetical protein
MNTNFNFPFQQPPLGYGAEGTLNYLENKPTTFLQQPTTGILPQPNNMMFGMQQQTGFPNTTNNMMGFPLGIQQQQPGVPLMNAPNLIANKDNTDTTNNQINNFPFLINVMKQYQQQNPEYNIPGIELYQKNDEDRFIIKNVDENSRKGYTSNDIEMFNEIYKELKDAVDGKKSKVEQLKLLYAFQNFYSLTDEQINEYAILTGVVKPNTSKKIKEIEQNIINKYVGDFFKRYPKADDINSANWKRFKSSCFQDYLRNTKYFSKLSAVAIDANNVSDIIAGEKFKNNIYYDFDNNVLEFCPLKDIYPTDKEGKLFDTATDKKNYIVWDGKNFFTQMSKEDVDKGKKKVFGKLKLKEGKVNGAVEYAGAGMLSVESEIRFMDIVLNKGFKLIASNSKINLDYITNAGANFDKSVDGSKSSRRKLSKKKKSKSRRRNKSTKKSSRKSLKKSLRKLKKHFLHKRRSMKIYQKK